jgi:hypothetical protein
MPKKKSYKSLGKSDRWEKDRLIRILLRRRFQRGGEIHYLLKYVNNEQVDDILRELLIWDEVSRSDDWGTT